MQMKIRSFKKKRKLLLLNFKSFWTKQTKRKHINIFAISLFKDSLIVIRIKLIIKARNYNYFTYFFLSVICVYLLNNFPNNPYNKY